MAKYDRAASPALPVNRTRAALDDRSFAAQHEQMGAHNEQPRDMGRDLLRVLQPRRRTFRQSGSTGPLDLKIDLL